MRCIFHLIMDGRLFCRYRCCCHCHLHELLHSWSRIFAACAHPARRVHGPLCAEDSGGRLAALRLGSMDHVKPHRLHLRYTLCRRQTAHYQGCFFVPYRIECDKRRVSLGLIPQASKPPQNPFDSPSPYPFPSTPFFQLGSTPTSTLLLSS